MSTKRARHPVIEFATSRRLTLGVLTATLIVTLAACAPTPTVAPNTLPPSVDLSASAPANPAPSETTPPATTEPQPATVPAALAGTARAALEQLPVHERATNPTYDRDQFGAAWADIDHNGCDTRNDILARDLTNITMKTDCLVATGTLHSLYTDATVPFTRGTGTSSKVQIDHVVALKDAWETGAYALTSSQRARLANDPLNLQAIEGNVNAAKSASDAAEWLPTNVAYRCTYVARQVSVKLTYGLWVTPAEKTAIANVLASCPDQPTYPSGLPAAR